MQSLKLSRQPSNIVRERSTLYFRQIIPKDLRHCWGKSSIKLSLKTGNVVKAKRKAAVMSAMIWDIFTALRKGDGRMTGLSTEELRALANSWLKEILEADEIDRMRGLTAEQRLFWRQEKDDSGNTVDLGYSQTVIEEIDKALETNDYSPSRYDLDSDTEGQEHIGGVFMLEKYINDFIRKHGIEIDRDSPEYTALSRELAKVYKLYLEIGQLRTAGDYYGANRRLASYLAAERSSQTVGLSPQIGGLSPRPMVSMGKSCHVSSQPIHQTTEEAAALAAEAAELDRATGITITLRNFIKEYLTKQAVTFDTKTQKEKNTTLNRFLDYIGNVELHKIPVDKAKRYRELYYALPKYLESARYKGKSLEELAALDLDDSDRIAPRTAYKNLSDIRAALNWGIKEGYRVYKELPSIIAGPKPKEKIPAEEKRNAFTADDIKAMLDHRGYTADSFEYSFQFWLPLLGLYTGARMGELCRINPMTDIKQSESGLCWFIDLMDYDDDEIKNNQSRRRIPIHKDLIDAGFIEFIQRRQSAGQALIFPELANEREDGAINAKASRWFNDRFRKECGIESVPRKIVRTDVKKDFHSFRHTFAAYAITHGVDSKMLEYCQGHKSSQTSSQVLYVNFWGNKEAPDLVYREVIEKMNYSKDFGIDIVRFRGSKFAMGKSGGKRE